MAVVVKKTNRNHYKMHRVLTPDGKMFVLTENNDAEPITAGGITAAAKAAGEVTPTIESASKLSISTDTETVKDELTAEQQLKAAQKRIKQLEGINQHLREQMKLTPDYTPDARDIRKAAKLFMAEYGGSWSKEELEGFANGPSRAYWAQILNEGGTIDSVSAIERSRLVEHIPSDMMSDQSYSIPASATKITLLCSNVNHESKRSHSRERRSVAFYQILIHRVYSRHL